MSDLLFQGRAPRLWLRLEQHGDKPVYAQMPPGHTDGYIVNANLIEGSPSACASFLGDRAKPFLIDPMTYRFGRPAWYTRGKDDEVVGKRNYAKLWARYAEGVTGLSGDPIGDRGAAAVWDEVALARYCRNVVDFQETRLAHAWLDDGIQYTNITPIFTPDQLGLDISLAPTAYVAPYVVIGDGDRATEADRAILLTRLTAVVARPRPVIAVLALTSDALGDRPLLRRLASGLSDAGVTGVLLWTVGVSAGALAEAADLFTGLTMLVRQLRDADLEVGMLYGGFVAALLRGFGVGGFSHMSLYGEQRGLEPSGGRAPTSFYFPPLHTFLSYETAKQLVQGVSAVEYQERVCGCALCAAIVADGPPGLRQYFETYLPPKATRPMATPEAADLNRLHFLLARGEELQMARERSEAQLIADWAAAADAYPSQVTRVARAWTKRLRAA